MTNRWDSKYDSECLASHSVFSPSHYFLTSWFLEQLHFFWGGLDSMSRAKQVPGSLLCHSEWLANNIKSFKSKLRIIWQAIQVRPLEVWSFFQHHNKKLTLSFNNIYPNLSHSNVVACTLTTLRCQITTSTNTHSTKNLWAQSEPSGSDI